MKTLLKTTLIIVCALFSVSALAQNPDQNPNYQVSQDKYMAKSDELTKNEGETIQQTYKAFDWTEHKAEMKQQRQDRRYELKKMRYESRYRCYSQPFCNNPYGYNYGYYNNYNPYGYQNQYFNAPTNFYSGMLLGAGLYYLFN